MVRWREEFKISPAIGNDCGVFVSKTEFEYGDVDCLGYIPIQTLLDIEHGHTDMGEYGDENFFLPECQYYYYWREIQIHNLVLIRNKSHLVEQMIFERSWQMT